jgi:hypothetical protein
MLITQQKKVNIRAEFCIFRAAWRRKVVKVGREATGGN